MRPDDQFSKRGSAVLDAPEEMYALPPGARRRPRLTDPEPRVDSGRDFDDDFAEGLPEHVGEASASSRRQREGVRFRFNGRPVRLPRTLWGRIFSGAGVLLFLCVVVGGLIAVRSFFLHDPRFVIEASSSIESVGNAHVTRAQLLSVFGEDVERNIFNVPLAQRRFELERLPWVEHATVMRLLPNHVRILITERVPVALVRQGTQLSMVDAHGVLLDIPADTPSDPHYSFPVITGGIGADDPLSTREARMKIFGQFMGALDSTGEAISKKISEIDLSNPEDVKALMFEGSSDVLVHFGDAEFLERYRKFEAHLTDWRTQYPKLSSVDMRYDRQVVLDMQPGSEAAALRTGGLVSGPVDKAASQKDKGTPLSAIGATRITAKPVLKSPEKVSPKVPVKASGKQFIKAAAKSRSATAAVQSGKRPAPAASGEEWHMVVVKPHSKASAALAAKSPHSTQARPQ